MGKVSCGNGTDKINSALEAATKETFMFLDAIKFQRASKAISALSEDE